ncbi:MAG: rubrerythrin family protein [Deltaproteobacteria bacterium]|nr:rubrerythrin family protein [Deltaproteobacteria bacterium]
MDDTVREAVHQAYAGEAKALLRLRAFAEKAEEEGYPQLALLFRVIACSEEIHGKRALRLLKGVGTTEKNLAESFESEEKVAGVAYGEFVKRAEESGDRAAALYFSQSRDVEEVHAKLYKEAIDNLLEERQTTYHVCTVCGYVSDGILPDRCPICGVDNSKFRNVE